jgi:competence ComEA-like helix-hairpin-helix protein
MQKKLIFLVLSLVFTIFCFNCFNVSAECSENQINVNSASLSELDKIYGIGLAKAQAIIDARPYETLDDLVNAYGIGEATLERIKQDGLACVEGDEEKDDEIEENDEDDEDEIEENDEDENDEKYEEKNTEEQEQSNKEAIKEEIQEEKEQSVTAGVIRLDSKDIKTKNNKEEIEKDEVDKNKFAKIGLGFIGVFLLVLLFLQNKKGKIKKNEFK